VEAAGIAVPCPGATTARSGYVETPDGLRMESWKTRRNRCRSGTSTCTCFCKKRRSEGSGLVRQTFGARRPATTPLWSTFRALSSACQGRHRHRARTLGRVLDHIGFDVKDLKAFIAKIEGEGIKLDEPYRETPDRQRDHLHHGRLGHPHRADQSGVRSRLVIASRQEGGQESQAGRA